MTRRGLRQARIREEGDEDGDMGQTTRVGERLSDLTTRRVIVVRMPRTSLRAFRA